MKRKGNLYQGIISKENLMLADKRARKGKRNTYGVKKFDQNYSENIALLHDLLKNKTYKTSKYKIFKVMEEKERIVYQLPYFPDRIVHHAIMVPLEKIFCDMFTADTYSCIKKKGIHAASFSLRKQLLDIESTTYCLKLDVTKFYASIDHDILKALLRRKLKDPDLLWLLDEIIDSAPGVPIGNYLSQYFANFYLTGFDHWLKERMGVERYIRYSDDIVITHHSKEFLHKLLHAIREYLEINLKLSIKGNYQIFLVEARGIDVVGYVHRHHGVYIDIVGRIRPHTGVRLRKRIKQKFARQLHKRKDRASIDSYMGWLVHGNCKNLTKKLLYGIRNTSKS